MIRYQADLEGIDASDIAGFWEGWRLRPTPEAHLRALAGSEAFVLAVDPDAGGRVVGFVTAVGDGLLAAYIPFLEVLPEYRGRGIGTGLVQRLMQRLGDRYMIDLTCDEDLVPFYRRFGMRPQSAMVIRHPDALAALR